jgi:ABC-2 type transport system permease protein
VNREHLRAFFWLHWRLRVNQLKRGGTANAVLMAILAVGAALLAVVLFLMFLLIGLFALSDASPVVLMYLWDALVLALLVFWMIGLISDLQRAEALSMEKFLHLPVSLTGVFVLNYLTSLFSVSLILMVPAMLGFALGLILGRGLGMLLLLPLLAAFLLMLTALTYQFQGWLASLMVNKRRRRTIVVVVTGAFLLLFQLPNLISMYRPWRQEGPDDLSVQLVKEQTELDRARQAGEITAKEYQQRFLEMQERYRTQMAARHRQVTEQVSDIARIANLVIPLGWLPWGAMAAAEGNGHYTLLAILGMTLIGAASLRRAYRTTVRLYTGQFTSGKKRAATAPPVPQPPRPPEATREPRRRGGLLEKQLPWVSEHAAAIALSSLRALTRAPEVKMLLLGPVVMMAFFAFVLLRAETAPPPAVVPLMATGALAMTLLTMMQLLGNQFGFDRSGFRVFVLCPAPRRDILLGKNLAIAPLALSLGLVGAALVQVAFPMRLDRFLAVVPQAISMYLLFCLLANCLSILAPMPIAAGTLRPTNTRVIVIVLHFAVVFVLPIVIGPTLVPLGLELLLEALGWVEGMPIALVLGICECVGVIYFFRWLIGWQGVWLQAREQRILEIVTTKAE